MTLADDLRAVTAVVKGPRCSVNVLLAELDPADSAVLADFISRPTQGTNGIASTQIAAVLAKHKHPIRHEVIQRHRRRACSCWPTI